VCYIDNIYGANVDNTDGVARIVFVDPDGRVGTFPVGTPTPSPSPTPTPPDGNQGKVSGLRRKIIPDPVNEAILNFEVQSLEATTSQQQNQIEMLTDEIKQQVAEIQQVNARLQMKKPAATTIASKPEALPFSESSGKLKRNKQK
jgi:hypothetical protein